MKLPEPFIKIISDQIGKANSEALFECILQQAAITSIRLNPNKIKFCPFKESQPIHWEPNGYYLTQRPEFVFDPLWHAGAYYVQEAGSMLTGYFIQQLIDKNKAIRAIDICAAPGGKSTQILQCISKESYLVSNEIIKTRTNILIENLTKWGNINVFITQNSIEQINKLKNHFDLLILDAPCSGEGLFRKSPESITQWSEDNVKHSAERQRKLLALSYEAVAENGIILYSTCTYNHFENKDNCIWFSTHFDVEILTLNEVPNGVFEVEEKSKTVGYQCFPHQTKTEGFFICAFRKLQTEKRNTNKSRKKQVAENNVFFDLSGSFQETFEGKKLIMNALMAEDYSIIKDNLYLKKAGINLGETIHNQFNPTPESAFCNLPKKSISIYNCSLHEALKFLNKSLLYTENEINKGWILMQYNGISIGWIKNIGNRINNYYPSEWRIIKQIPENIAE